MPSYMQLMASSTFPDDDSVFGEHLGEAQGSPSAGNLQGETKREPAIKIDVRGKSLIYPPFKLLEPLCQMLAFYNSALRVPNTVYLGFWEQILKSGQSRAAFQPSHPTTFHT